MEKITNGELKSIKQGLESALKERCKLDFSMWAVETIDKINKEVEMFTKANEPFEEFKEKYQPRLDEVLKKYCKKDDKTGEPVMTPQPGGKAAYQFDPNIIEELNEAILELEAEEEIAPIVEARKNQEEEFAELMKQETKLKIKPVKKELVPDPLPGDVIKKIFKLIS